MRILGQRPVQYDWAPLRIAIVTGLSNPLSCSLSPEQRSLLEDTAENKSFAVLWNFPFIPDSVPDRAVSLLQASIANGAQFLRCATKSYRQLAAPHWEAITESTGKLFVVAGSCGFQLINTWPVVQKYADCDRIQAIALGPVGIGRARFPVTIVQGSRDWISRSCIQRADHLVKGVGHLDYWKDIQVREIVQRWLRDRISESSAQLATYPNTR